MAGLHEVPFTMRVTQLEEACMRGDDHQQAAMWSCLSPEQRVPADHPLRPIRTMVNTVLAELSPDFATLYSPVGRPSIPPEKLLRALLPAGALHRTQRTVADGAARLQPAVPLVRGPEPG
jgi:hypothetical protein